MIKLHLVIFIVMASVPFFAWRARTSPVLTFVDYKQIADRAEFNRLAAFRLLPMPAMALLCLAIVSTRPDLGLPLLLLELLAVLASANWVLMEAARFRQRTPSRGAA
jgi:hypothetical protein